MIALNNLINKVNKKTYSKPIFYITADYERGLGLENLLENYHIVTLDNTNLRLLIDNNIKVFGIERENIKATEIIRDEHVLDYIYENSKGNFFVQTFKNSERFEARVNKINGFLLNDSYNNNVKFERKIDQYNQMNRYKINFPETEIIILGEKNYNEIAHKLGRSFVLQFNIGHTGSGTHFINTKEEYSLLQNSFPNREARVSKLVLGNTYTVNGCIYNYKAYFAGLSLQITGITPYANTKSATIGNDWVYAYKNLNNQKNSILSELNKVGNALANENYRGLFGIDFIIDESGKAYIIEINARQPASIPMNTKLQLLENQIPLSLLHIAEFLNIREEIDNNIYNEECLFISKGSQLFIRYGLVTKLISNDISTGIYTLDSNKKLQKVKNSYDIEILVNNQFILLNKNKNKPEVGDEIARIQQLKSVMENHNKINNNTTNIIENLT